MTTLEQFLNEHALETAREFGIESRADGQGTADSATGASSADIVQAVRDYTTGSTVSNADILISWLNGYNSEIAIALAQQWGDGAITPHIFVDDSNTNHTASAGIYCAVCSHELAHSAHNEPSTPGANMDMTTRQIISAKRAELGLTECPICFISPARTVVEFGVTVCAGRNIGNDHGMPYVASTRYSA